MKKKVKLKNKSKRKNFYALKVLFALGVYIVLVFTISKAQAAIDKSSIPDITFPELIQRLRRGDPETEANPENVVFRGVRSISDPIDAYVYTPMDMALERVAGIDINGSGREQIIDNAADHWSESTGNEDDVSQLQAIVMGMSYLPKSDPDIKEVRESAREGLGSLRMEDMPFFGSNFLMNDTLVRAQTLGEQSKISTVLGTINPSENLPLIAGERSWGTASTSGGSVAGSFTGPDGTVLAASTGGSDVPKQGVYSITQPASSTTKAATLAQEAPWNTAYNQPYAKNRVSVTSPDQKLPATTSGAAALQGVLSTLLPGQNAGGIGQSQALSDGTDPLHQDLFDQYMNDQMLRDLQNRINQNLQRSQDFNNFFGNNIGGLNDAFGNVNDLINIFSPPGSGGDTPVQNIENQTPEADPVTSECQGETQHYTSGEAKSIAAIIGLPLKTMNTWKTVFIPKSSVINNARVTKKTGGSVLSDSDFPSGEKCLWSVVSTASSPIQAVFIEDVRTTSGTKILINIAP